MLEKPEQTNPWESRNEGENKTRWQGRSGGIGRAAGRPRNFHWQILPNFFLKLCLPNISQKTDEEGNVSAPPVRPQHPNSETGEVRKVGSVLLTNPAQNFATNSAHESARRAGRTGLQL